MLVFPNCKINLGLHVVSKRTDGFHNIETVFYPVSWCDALEVIENRTSTEKFSYTQSGSVIEGALQQNLVYKAWDLICQYKTLPPLQVHLHKTIPMGAGLGGGSSDAAHFINLLDEQFHLELGDELKMQIAAQLGSDCAFFIKNKAVLAQGKGDEFSPLTVDLSTYHILLVYPSIHSNTKEAYEGLTPKTPENSLPALLSRPPEEWKDLLENDFEASLFKKYPEIADLKHALYKAGAIYSSMSGSGSAVFGIFNTEPFVNLPGSYQQYLQKPQSKIL